MTTENTMEQNTAKILDLKATPKTHSSVDSESHVILLNVDSIVRNRLLKENSNNFEFKEINQTEQLLQELKHKKHNIDALILGLQHKEPARFAQRIHFMDKTIPLLILTEPDHHDQLKNVLKFSPFFGDRYTDISN